MLGVGWTTASLTMQLTSGVSVFAYVWEQMLDTFSNFCDNNNIYSAIWMKLSFFDKYGTIFNFILQLYDKFELLNSKGSAATYFRCGGK